MLHNQPIRLYVTGINFIGNYYVTRCSYVSIGNRVTLYSCRSMCTILRVMCNNYIRKSTVETQTLCMVQVTVYINR